MQALSQGRALRSLGHAQAAAGAIDASTLLSAIAAIPAGTERVLIQAEAQAVRWRDDGTAPTATVGFPLATGVMYTYEENDFARLRFISQVAGAILNIAFYGRSVA